ncbi:hypothetical protein V493_04782 [Pseudogymnoascus sp. VKM F-4281 (FW-2241)]|nr:hypothetical protein V493_04782 [Pseudogymnoascus sp. VKM F-4281 (FW-2241)]
MPVLTTDQLKAAATKQAPCKNATRWTSAVFSKLTTKRTAGATAAAKPVGHLTHDVAKTNSQRGPPRRILAPPLPRSCIIRNPKDRFDGRLPEFFALVKRGGTEQKGREMTAAELEEVGFAYGEDLEVLEMQGMKLMGWVAEDEEVEMRDEAEAKQFL